MIIKQFLSTLRKKGGTKLPILITNYKKKISNSIYNELVLFPTSHSG